MEDIQSEDIQQFLLKCRIPKEGKAEKASPVCAVVDSPRQIGCLEQTEQAFFNFGSEKFSERAV